MSDVPIRSLAAELVIGVALCAGAYMLVMQPLELRLAEATAKTARAQADALASRETAKRVDSLRQQLAEAKAWADRVERLSVCARDEAGMLAAVMQLAGKHGVRVDEIVPSGHHDASDVAAGKTVRAGYSLRVAATYPDLVAFLDHAPKVLGLMRIESLAIGAPSRSAGEKVQAVVRTEHFGFDVAAMRVAAGEGDR